MFNVKQKHRGFRKAIGVFLCLWLGWYQTSFASLDVMDDDMEGFYGEAETPRFKAAAEGTEELSARDRAFLEGIDETRTSNRWYARALIGRGRVKINNLTNESSGPVSSTLVLSNSSFTDNLIQVLVAGGYIWEHWAMEAELFFNKPLKYNPNPTFVNTPNSSAEATIKVYTLFFNISYIIPRWFDFYPRRLQIHLDAGAGPVIKTTSVTASENGQQLASSSSRIFSVAGQLGVGARYQMTQHFLVDIAYRYMDFGKTKYGPIDLGINEEIFITSKQLRSNGFFIGFTYQS